MKHFFILLLFGFTAIYAQTSDVLDFRDTTANKRNQVASNEYYQPGSYESKYFEDQFYIGVQFVGSTNRDSSIENQSLPYSLNAGFIKDLPLNPERNMGLGLGLGYNLDILHPNIAISSPVSGKRVAVENTISQTDIITHSIEVPLEFRWRTSTAEIYTFWRIYSGVSYLYNFSNKTSFTDLQGFPTDDTLPDSYNKQNFTVYTSIGYGTWNFHVKYYLQPFFKKGTIGANGTPLDYNHIKFGLMFYIL